jgi:hypothetical protein
MERSIELLIQVIIFALLVFVGITEVSLTYLHIFLPLKKISHYITPIRIILFIQPHNHRLKQTSFLAAIIKKKKKKKQIAKEKKKQNTILQILKKYLLEVGSVKVVFEIRSCSMQPCSDTILNNLKKIKRGCWDFIDTA